MKILFYVIRYMNKNISNGFDRNTLYGIEVIIEKWSTNNSKSYLTLRISNNRYKNKCPY